MDGGDIPLTETPDRSDTMGLSFLFTTLAKLASPVKGQRIGGIMGLLFPNLNRGK